MRHRLDRLGLGSSLWRRGSSALSVAAVLGLGVLPVVSQTAAILPNAMSQFSDGNGAPYAGGHLYTYVPGTTTPRVTWQDPNETTPNTNPIVLDANGRAIIWGTGLYREVLQDQFGNTIWDQLSYVDAPNTAAAAVIPTGMVSWFYLPACPTGWAIANGTSSADIRGRYIRDLDQGTGRDPSGTTLGGAYASANGPVTGSVGITGTTAAGTFSGNTGTVVTAITNVGTGGTLLAGGTDAVTSASSPVSGTTSPVLLTGSGNLSCTNCGVQTVVDTVVLLACQKQ